jgi:hypothetical protein
MAIHVLGAWESLFHSITPFPSLAAGLHADAASLEARGRTYQFKDFGFKLVIWVFNGNPLKWLRD